MEVTLTNNSDGFKYNEIFEIIISAIGIIYGLVHMFASILLVLGVHRKQHRKLILIMILMVIDLGIIFYNFSECFWNYVINTTLKVLFLIYLLQCLYSLYAKIKNENDGIEELDNNIEEQNIDPEFIILWLLSIVKNLFGSSDLDEENQEFRFNLEDEECLLRQ
ncbi:hypothetical protein PVAND_006032 [Polypedilum vanderplanki]|uniref:Transmembrane protein n=1 Tax=Polypedilum vanderplanki TaxID=319348 RepID=A0A9J6C2B8_POLVA|nr:hypothetical protein PVAND_006032 [Polypedilum vanderplanki]